MKDLSAIASRPQLSRLLLERDISATIDSGGHDSEALADRTLLWQQTVRALARLPKQQQWVLMLHYLRGATTTEVAAIMGITESRVSQVHRRALECLRTRLQRFGGPR